MAGISDTSQAFLMLAALLLISIGAVTLSVPTQIPSPTKDYIGLALILAGAIGAALKEWLGTQTKAATTTPPAPAPPAATIKRPPAQILRMKRRVMWLAFVK